MSTLYILAKNFSLHIDEVKFVKGDLKSFS